MRKTIITLGLGLALLSSGVQNAHALSCLPIDMYLESVIGDETTQVFIGTATEVTKAHTQVVTVTKALQSWVAPKVWVEHPYSTDWKYFCSNGPAEAGEPTVFLTTLNEYGTYSVTQTLSPDSVEAKKLIKDLGNAEDAAAGITEATADERASEVLQTIQNVIKALINLFAEYRYWQSQ